MAARDLQDMAKDYQRHGIHITPLRILESTCD